MARSLAKAGLLEGMEVRIASPAGYAFSADELAALQAFADRVGRGGTVQLTDDPRQAAKGAAALYTDVWTSMGQEEERAARLAAFAGYTVDDDAGRPGRRRRRRAALPAGAPRRGDHRRRARGPALAWCGARPPTAARPCGGSWPGSSEGSP